MAHSWRVASTELPSQPERPSRSELLALAAILVLGLVLRFAGLGFLSPQQSEPDGVVYDAQVRILEDGDPAQERHALFAYYPHLVARLAAALPHARGDDPRPRELERHLAQARAHRVKIRAVVAALSSLAILAAWGLARRFLEPRWALVAALLQATSVLSIWFAQQARPHAVVSAFVALGVVAALGVARRGRVLDWCFAALVSAAGIATLQNGLAVVPPLVLAAWFAFRASAVRAVVGGLAVVAVCAAAVLWFYPFLFAASDGRAGGVQVDGQNLRLSNHIVMLDAFNGRGFATVGRALRDYEPLVALLAAAGIALGLVACARGRVRGERARELLVALAFVVPYVLAIGLYERTYQRFVLPLVPFLCVAAAGALAWTWVRARFAQPIVVGLVALELYAAVQLVRARSERDTISQAADWIGVNAEPASMRIDVMPSVDLPLLQTLEARDANQRANLDVAYPWYSYLWRQAPSAFAGPLYDLRTMPLYTESLRAAARADVDAFVAGLKGRFVVVEVFRDDRWPLLQRIRAAIAQRGKLVARFVPDRVDAGNDLPILYQDDEFKHTDVWWWRILFARSVGPVLEIYELR